MDKEEYKPNTLTIEIIKKTREFLTSDIPWTCFYDKNLELKNKINEYPEYIFDNLSVIQKLNIELKQYNIDFYKYYMKNKKENIYIPIIILLKTYFFERYSIDEQTFNRLFEKEIQ
jgi:hypothetical protein